MNDNLKYHKNRLFFILSESNFTVYGYHQGEDESDALNYPKKEIQDHPSAVKLPKLTPAQKARKRIDELREMPVVWAWVGWLATHSARIRASAPKHLQERESEKLSAGYGVCNEIGRTLTGNENYTNGVRGAQGPSYSVVYDDFGFSHQFEMMTGITARPTLHTQGKLSTQQWQPVLVLLLSDLKFKLSAENEPAIAQDIISIRNKVPQCFLLDFDAGVRGEFSSYFQADFLPQEGRDRVAEVVQ